MTNGDLAIYIKRLADEVGELTDTMKLLIEILKKK